MVKPDEKPETGDSAFEAALGEYLRRVDAGEKVDRAAFAAGHPKVAAELNSYFATAEALEQVGGPRRSVDSHPKQSIDTARGLTSQETVPPPGSRSASGERNSAEAESGDQLFGRYRLLKVLGQGAMGVVHLARDVELDREVALKVPRFTQADAPELIERFYREARSAAALHHRNICPLFDIGEVDGMRYITMAYVDGRPLSDFINADKPIAQRQIAGTVRKLALALAVAHDRGVIHRDLKPANILIDRSKEPVIMDFGLARQINKPEDVRITQSGALVGSPAYMSPEQVESRLDVIGPRSDIYSLGVILYELLTGQLPFQGSIASVIGQIMSVQPKKPSERRADVDKGLESICLRMMSKKFEDRYASMLEVADALLAYLKDPKAGADHRASLSGLNLPTEDWARPIAASTAKPAQIAASPRKLASREECEALYRTAQKCVRAHDYEQAIGILDQVPDERLTDEMRRLRDKAQETQDEVDLLLADIEETRQRRNQEGLQEKVERLLELKPGHDYARQLYARLTARSHREPRTVRLKLGPLGIFRIPSWVANAAVLATGGLLLYGVFTMFFSTDKGKVRVEIDEKFLAQGNVTITFDEKKTVEITENGQKISIEPGEHTFVVKRGDAVIEANRFTLSRGGTEVLRVFAEGSVANASSPVSKTPPPTSASAQTSPRPASPAALATATVVRPKAPPTGRIVGVKEVWRLGGDAQTFGRAARYVRFSPDGRYLATMYGSMSPKIVDVATGKVLHQVQQPGNAGIAFTPDGRSAVIRQRAPQGKVPLLDLANGEMSETALQVDIAYVNCEFTADGKRLVVGNMLDLAVIDWPNGPVRRHSFKTIESGYAYDLSPDGKLFVAGTGSKAQVTVWNRETETQLADFRAHPAPHWLTSVCFMSNGATVVTTSHDGKLKRWNSQTGKLQSEWPHGDWLEEAALSPDDRYMAVVMHTRGTWIWDVAKNEVAVRIPPHELNGSGVAYSPDGRYVATASAKHNSQWAPKSAKPDGFSEVKLWELQYDGSSTPAAVVPAAPPATSAQTGGASSPFAMWTLTGHTASIRQVAISPDSKWIASCGYDQSVRIWDAQTGQQVHALNRDFESAEFSPDGKNLLLGQGRDNPQKAIVWLKVGDWKEVRRFKNAGAATHSLTFNPSGTHLLTLHPQRIRLRTVADGAVVQDFEKPDKLIGKLMFTPDGKTVFGYGEYDKIFHWDAQSGKLLRTLKRPAGDMAVVAPDARTVIASAWSGGIGLLEFQTGRELKHIGAYDGRGSARGVAISSDGRYALYGCEQRAACLVHIETGAEVARFGGQLEQVQQVHFAPNGKFAVSASGEVYEGNRWRAGKDRGVHVWRLPADVEVKPASQKSADATSKPGGARLVDLYNGKDHPKTN